MSEWLDLMLEEVERKRKERREAEDENSRREAEEEQPDGGHADAQSSR